MVGYIVKNRPFEFVSIEYKGYVYDGEEDTESEGAKAFAGAHESYTFREKEGQTEVLIDCDTEEKYIEMFEKMWPHAIQNMKTIAEE